MIRARLGSRGGALGGMTRNISSSRCGLCVELVAAASRDGGSVFKCRKFISQQGLQGEGTGGGLTPLHT